MTDGAQIVRFIVVGLLTALVYYGFLVVAVELAGLGAVAASGLSYVLAVAINYLLHYHWTFTADSGHAVVASRYMVMLCGGFIINVSAMYVGASIMGWHYLLVQTAAVGFIATWNYVLSSLWVFRD